MDNQKNEYKRTDQQYFSWNVPAVEQHFDPSSKAIIAAVALEYEQLLLLPKVRELNDEISKSFPNFVRSLIDVSEMKIRFDAIAPRYPNLKFKDV